MVLFLPATAKAYYNNHKRLWKMRLIKNKNVQGSIKIIKLKEEEAPGKAQQLLNHYQDGGVIVIEGFKPKNVNYSMLQQCMQQNCSYNWGDKSKKKLYTKPLLKASKASEEMRSEILASERSIFRSVHRIFNSMLSSTDLHYIDMRAQSLWRCLPTIDENIILIYPILT